MIRIHAGEADLGRIRFAERPEPLWETALGVRALGRLPLPRAIRSWRQQVRPRVHPGMRPMLSLFSPAGQFPDFLTPEPGDGGLDGSLKVLADVPAEVIEAGLGPYLPPGCHDGWAGELMAGRASARRDLGAAVRMVHDAAIAPAMAGIERRYAADLAIRSRTLLGAGLDAVLASLHPDVDWRPPVLTAYRQVQGPPLDVHLEGRGLLLYPTGFVTSCLVLDEPGRTPVLIYPAIEVPYAESPDHDALAELLGRTRAVVLTALGSGASTTQLARRAGISLASASEHARVLRQAGLVETQRTGRLTLHSLTPAGRALLTTASPSARLRSR